MPMKTNRFTLVLLCFLFNIETSLFFGAEVYSEKGTDVIQLHRYRRHFASITCWNLYDSSSFSRTDGCIFDTDHLLLTGDQYGYIFISDAVSGKVFRAYDCYEPEYGKPVKNIASISGSMTNNDDTLDEIFEDHSRVKIKKLAISPKARFIAYVDGEDTECHYHVLDSITGYYIESGYCTKVLSLNFQDSESTFHCDVLEVIYENSGETFRKFYSIPHDISQPSFEIVEVATIEDILLTGAFSCLTPRWSGDCSGGENGLENAIIHDIGARRAPRWCSCPVDGASPEYEDSETETDVPDHEVSSDLKTPVLAPGFGEKSE